MVIRQDLYNNILVRLGYTPISEAISSFHVMSDPEHHLSSRDWAIRKFQSLPEDMQNEILFFGKKFDNWALILDIFGGIETNLSESDDTLEKILSDFNSLDNREFVIQFLGLNVFGYKVEDAEKWIQNPNSISYADLGPQSKVLVLSDVVDFLNSIDEYKKRISNLVRDYWNNYFKIDWEPIREFFDEKITKEELLIRKEGLFSYLKSFNKNMVVKDSGILLKKEPEFCISFDDLKGINISYSIFLEPHFPANVLDNTLIISRTLNFHSLEIFSEVPESLGNVVLSISDTTRIKIVKLLWNGDMTTKEIADILNLSPSTISIHLNMLKNLNLVETHRVKRFVYYRLRRDPFYSLQNNLIGFFEF